MVYWYVADFDQNSHYAEVQLNQNRIFEPLSGMRGKALCVSKSLQKIFD